MKRVLFVCAGNTCRSPMAAALARDLLDRGIEVESAGTAASVGSTATPEAVQVMKERGLDLGAHSSRPITMVDVENFDTLVALTPSIARTLRERGVDESKLRVLDIADPFGGGLEVYRETAVAIERELRSLFK